VSAYEHATGQRLYHHEYPTGAYRFGLCYRTSSTLPRVMGFKSYVDLCWHAVREFPALAIEFTPNVHAWRNLTGERDYNDTAREAIAAMFARAVTS